MAEKPHIEKVFLLVGRDNWQRDMSLNFMVLKKLEGYNHKIMWEDPAGDLIYKLRTLESNFKWLPTYIKKLDLAALQFMYALTHWSYFSYLFDAKNEPSAKSAGSPIAVRCSRLKTSIRKLSLKNEVIIFGRSSGGRVASMVADEVAVKQIICLGYPFKHPEKDEEPGRYLHLKDLKTPMLIVQGTRDKYGGIEIKEKYELSPGINLFFINTDHDFRIDTADWDKVCLKIDEAVG